MTTLDQPGPRRVSWRTPPKADHRPDSDVCAVCCRSLLPRSALYRHRLPICRTCASQPNDPVLLEWWLAAPRHKRREWITVAFGLDPAEFSEDHLEADDTAVADGVSGVPADTTARTRNEAAGAERLGLPVNTFWRLPRKHPDTPLT